MLTSGTGVSEMSHTSANRPRPVWDVHAHYLPAEAIAPMGTGAVQVHLETVSGVDDHVTVNGMPVGATIKS